MIGGVSQAGSGLFLPVRSRRADNADAVRESVASNDQATEKLASEKNTAGGVKELTPDQQQQVADLKQRDAEVRQHEAAHQATGGAHAGGASYTYQRGPDGKNYAVGGEVQVDVSAAGTPEATIAKMDQIKAAALAPAEPSPQDQRVASMADGIKAQAQQELRQQQGQGPSQGENQSRNQEEEPVGGGSAGGSAESRRAAGAYAAAAAIGEGTGGRYVGGGFAVSA